MKNGKKILLVIMLIIAISMAMKGKKEGIYMSTVESNCLNGRQEKISGWSSSDPYWVSPCYKLTSQMDSCSSWIEPVDIGDYIYSAERFGRENLDSNEEEAISCAEDYGNPNPSNGDCGGGKIWSNGWCIPPCIPNCNNAPNVCIGTLFADSCGNANACSGIKICYSNFLSYKSSYLSSGDFPTFISNSNQWVNA